MATLVAVIRISAVKQLWAWLVLEMGDRLKVCVLLAGKAQKIANGPMCQGARTHTHCYSTREFGANNVYGQYPAFSAIHNPCNCYVIDVCITNLLHNFIFVAFAPKSFGRLHGATSLFDVHKNVATLQCTVPIRGAHAAFLGLDLRN